MASNAKNLAELLNQDSTVAVGDIADGSVTTAKLAADAVTAAKLADNAVVTANISDSAVTSGKVNPAGLNLGRRNIIINGDMSIAQRTASAVTINSGTIQYGIDRFGARGMSSAGVFTIEQSTDSPTNFVNSFKATVTTADSSIASNATYRVVQHIEGNMIRNLNWGTAQARDVTLSFKVKSSLTGTFGGAIINGDYNRFYNFSYTISSANTWTDVSVTIDGDTSGTWVTNNTLGIRLSLSLGAGSGEVGSAGSWGTATYEGVTGQTNLIATNGATWQITGVQLEVGSTATDFEHRPIGEELALCQRYFTKNPDIDGIWTATNTFRMTFQFPVTMRTGPTAAVINSSAYHEHWNLSGYTGLSSVNYNDADPLGTDFRVVSSSNRGRSYGNPAKLAQDSISFTAEL